MSFEIGTLFEQKPVRLRLYGWTVLLVWTLVLGISLAWNLARQDRILDEVALSSARVAIEKDILYRRWNASHGGVYVPVARGTAPNLYLKSPRANVTTTDGQQLTLVNPAYMIRMVHEMGTPSEVVHGHITSLEPLRAENAPDNWERQALEAISTGASEVYEVQLMDSSPYLRLMQPLRVELGCLECHGEQGYSLGDLRGGISATVSMQNLRLIEVSQARFLTMVHLFLWGIGLLGNHMGIRRLSAQLAERRRLQERVWHQANYDALTGVPNRSLFQDRLGRLVSSASRSAESFPLMFIDLDHFKAINDTLGHDAGDELLRQAAKRLLDCVRESDTVARIGGDEFTVILPGATPEGMVEKVAKKILQRLREPFDLFGNEVVISGSVGVAFFPLDAGSQSELLKQADLALYAAKRAGRGQVHFASDLQG